MSEDQLADRLIARLPHRPHLLASGADSVGLLTTMAQHIGRAQVWTRLDTDDARLGDAFAAVAYAAEAIGWTVTWPSRALLVHAPGGAWRIEGTVEPGLALAGGRAFAPDAVV